MNPISTEDFTEPLKGIFKGVKTKVVSVESRTKGTMILRCGGCFYKVLKLRSSGDNNRVYDGMCLECGHNRLAEKSRQHV